MTAPAESAAERGRTPSMRRGARNDVVSALLVRVRSRRDDLRRVLGGGRALLPPTVEEHRALEDEYRRLDLVEQGLTTLLPAAWGVTGEPRHRFSAGVEAEVVRAARAELAVAGMLLVGADPESAEVAARWRNAVAAFEFLHAEVLRLEGDAEARERTRKDPPVPPRPPDRRTVAERMVVVQGWGSLMGGS